MDDSSSPSQPSSDASLAAEVRSLRIAVHIALVALVVLASALSVYFLRQVSLLRRQSQTSERIAEQMVQHYNLNVSTQAQTFEARLRDIADKDAELKARLAKFYAPSPQTSSPPPPPSPTP
jgi:hypothetical protein